VLSSESDQMAYFPDVIPSPVPMIDDPGVLETSAMLGNCDFNAAICAAISDIHPGPWPVHGCQSFRSHWAPASYRSGAFQLQLSCTFKAHPDVAAQLPYNVAIVHFCPCVAMSRVVSKRPLRSTTTNWKSACGLSLVREQIGNSVLFTLALRRNADAEDTLILQNPVCLPPATALTYTMFAALLRRKEASKRDA